MARTTKNELKLKQKRYEAMLSFFKEVAEKHNLKEDVVLNVFKQAVRIVYAKLKGGEDVNVEVVLNEEALDFEARYLKVVVASDDDVTDDALEIGLEDALLLDKEAVVGGDVVVEKTFLEKFNTRTSENISQNFRHQLTDIEKEQLLNLFKDKIGELVKGKVEKNDKTTYINLMGITNVLFNERGKEAIPGEIFKNGQELNFYIKEVVSGTKGAIINISRSDENFVKRLMEREIHEIYDGTIVIHKIVREPGERVKVAVESLDPNVDPVGSCIGPSASRIQKITAELGPDGRKEKIDIIPWNKNQALYIFEAFRPAVPLGVAIDNENKSAKVVFPVEEKGKAFGNKGANIRLAVALTGYKLSILDVDEANSEGVEYLSKVDIEYEARIADQMKAKERIQRELARSEELAAHVAGQKELLENEVNNLNIEELHLKDDVFVEQPVVVKPERVVEEVIQSVKTTISLADLEADLAKEKNEAPKEKPVWKKEDRRSRPFKKEEKPTEVIEPVLNGPKMDIYTEDEIAELEKVNSEVEEDDIDYDEFDEYYKE